MSKWYNVQITTTKNIMVVLDDDTDRDVSIDVVSEKYDWDYISTYEIGKTSLKWFCDNADEVMDGTA